MLPPCYPHDKTVHRRFEQWCQREVLRHLANTLREPGVIDERESVMDASFATAKGGSEGIGLTKRDNGVKSLAIVDREGLPRSGGAGSRPRRRGRSNLDLGSRFGRQIEANDEPAVRVGDGDGKALQAQVRCEHRRKLAVVVDHQRQRHAVRPMCEPPTPGQWPAARLAAAPGASGVWRRRHWVMVFTVQQTAAFRPSAISLRRTWPSYHTDLPSRGHAPARALCQAARPSRGESLAASGSDVSLIGWPATRGWRGPCDCLHGCSSGDAAL